MMELSIESMYRPEGHSLGTLVTGLSGSGKTTMIISTLQQAIKSTAFGPHHRFILIDPKQQSGDYDLLADPLYKIEDVFKSIRKERVTLYWPDLATLELDVSEVVEEIFHLSDSDNKSTYTIIIDEASILITPTRLPLSLKRLSVQGRAKRIKPVYISQRPITNRWIDANLSAFILQRILPLDADVLSKRWGLNFDEADTKLKEKKYSFIWFDLEEAELHFMNPVPLPKPRRRKKKKGVFTRFFHLI